MQNDQYFRKGGLSYSGVRSKRTGCSCFSMVGFLFFALIIIILFAVGIFYISDYNAWKNTFMLEADEKYFVEMDDIKDRERSDINRKINEFNESPQEVNFVEFTPREVAILLGESMEDALPTGVFLEAVYVEPYERKWLIYFKTYSGEIDYPWVGVELIKDDLQTAQLDVVAVYLGEDDLADYQLGFIADNLSQGYREALDLVNQSNITGRELENIELGTDMLIIKGRQKDIGEDPLDDII